MPEDYRTDFIISTAPCMALIKTNNGHKLYLRRRDFGKKKKPFYYMNYDDRLFFLIDNEGGIIRRRGKGTMDAIRYCKMLNYLNAFRKAHNKYDLSIKTKK